MPGVFTPTIIHIDMDAFYASIEQRDRPELRGNPKTGEPMTIYPRPDGAAVVVNGIEIGHVGWSLSGEDGVIVSGDPALIVPWAIAIAAELDAEFGFATHNHFWQSMRSKR